MPLEDLSRMDEHAVVVAAKPDLVWDAALDVVRRSFSGTWTRGTARLLGCDPSAASGWEAGTVGSTVPGFRVLAADRPDVLVLAGRHRFARYGIVLRVEPSPEGARCRLETRADFPGVHGRLYRLAVIGTGGHVVAVRHLLRRIQRAAQRRGAHW